MEDDEEETTASTLRGKPRPPPVSAQSAFSYIPPRRLDPKEHSYYYRQAQVRTAAGHGGGKAGRLGRGGRAAGRGGVGERGSPQRKGLGAGLSLGERAWGWGSP